MTHRIVYLSWPANEISGGIKLTYQHVEVLNAAGRDSVVATPDGNTPTWFSTTARTVALDSLRASDVLVFPENHNGMLKGFAGAPNRKVVFCQNPFMVYRGLNGARCYSDFGVTHVLAEGRQVVDFCERRFKKLKVFSVPVFVNADTFRLGTKKRMQIAFAPRKRPQEAEFIKDLFRSDHPQFSELPWVPIAGRNEMQVAQILGDSAIYLSLCRFEALPLSILEAFASGCIVAGFTGIGGRVYANSANGFWAEEDDCLDCTTQLGKAIRILNDGGDSLVEMLVASLATAKCFNQDRFSERILKFWNEVINS